MNWMNGLIMEIKPGYAVVMTSDGGFEEWKMDTETLVIGQEVEKPKSKSPVLQLGQFMHTGRKPVLQVAASLMLALMLSGTGAWAYYTPYGYINIDINPSVELTYNRFERIIDMKSLNDDGANVLEVASQIKNKSISDAIEQVVLSSEEQGYMKEDENIVLLTVTPINDSGDDVDTELSEVENWALTESVTLENRESDIENYEAAQKEGVSPGKKLLVKEAKRVLIEKGLAASEASTSNDSAPTVDEKSNLGQIMKIIRSKDAPEKSAKPDKEPVENNKDKTPAGQEKNNDKTPPGQEKKNGQDGLLEENNSDGESNQAPGQNKAPNENNGNGQSGRQDKKNKDHSNDSIEETEDTESINETEVEDQDLDESDGSQNAPGQNNKDKNNENNKEKNKNDDTGENSTNSGNSDSNGQVGNDGNNGNNGKKSNTDQNTNDEQSNSESDKDNSSVEDDEAQDERDSESSDEIDDGDADSSNSSKSSDKSDEKKNGNSNSKSNSNKNNNNSKGGKDNK